MPYTIDAPPALAKALDRLDERAFMRIRKAIDGLAQEPRPAGCKKLGGSVYRIRISDWRVIYAVFDGRKLVQLIRIARRSEKTYRKV